MRRGSQVKADSKLGNESAPACVKSLAMDSAIFVSMTRRRWNKHFCRWQPGAVGGRRRSSLIDAVGAKTGQAVRRASLAMYVSAIKLSSLDY